MCRSPPLKGFHPPPIRGNPYRLLREVLFHGKAQSTRIRTCPEPTRECGPVCCDDGAPPSQIRPALCLCPDQLPIKPLILSVQTARRAPVTLPAEIINRLYVVWSSRPEFILFYLLFNKKHQCLAFHRPYTPGRDSRRASPLLILNRNESDRQGLRRRQTRIKRSPTTTRPTDRAPSLSTHAR